VQRYVTQTLKLVVNQSKSRVAVAEGCEYLGFAFVRGRRATIKVAPKKLKAFKRRIKELTGRSRGISMKRRLTDLARYVRGWIGYFGLARQLDDFSNLDGWIRRRVRMCYWKQWRYPRTKVRKLTALGVSLDMAIKHAVSRKSYWRMCHTPAMRYAMTNKWLQEQGLFSLKQRDRSIRRILRGVLAWVVVRAITRLSKGSLGWGRFAMRRRNGIGEK